MRIAYVGPARGTSLHRAKALERLGHIVTIVDPFDWLGRSKWASRWLYHAGGIGVGLRVNRPLFAAVAKERPDLIFVNQGEPLGPALLRRLRTLNVPIVNYINDNPFCGRDNLRFRNVQRALPLYDVLVVVREENLTQARERGAKQVMRVWMTADEVAHQPRPLAEKQLEKNRSEVCFVGTWMPERGPFVASLIRHGVPLSIWGDNWPKAPEWPVIAPHWRGRGVYEGNAYASIIQSAKICLGLLSRGNQDLHTTRSMEIPALGGVLCAERTSEHLALYSEGKEAVFWENVDECAAVCKRLLEDSVLRHTIARRGHERALRNNHFNEPMLDGVIAYATRLFEESR